MSRVPDELDGERLDRVVAQMMGISRARARTIVDEGGVTVDGDVGEASDRVRGGVAIEIPPTAPEPELEPEPVEFEIVLEDDDLIVVDKPAGVLTHPAPRSREGTLAAGLLHRFPEIRGVGQTDRWGLVHRLDRDTSGLLVVARTEQGYGTLLDAMKQRKISRRYLALVAGRFPVPTGTIEAPITKDTRHPTRMKVHPEGKAAVTHYEEVEPIGKDDTLIEVTLETGRTHQIRVHLAAIDHPVIGDRVYGPGTNVRGMERHFLHAHRLSFSHPVTGAEIDLTSPLPPELAELL